MLTGQRRVGKSYILLQVMDEIGKRDPTAQIIYINKEDYSFEHIKTHDDLMTYLDKVKKSGGKIYLFIDEIQDISNFEIALRSLLAVDNWDIYCTGSNATLLSGELATYLSGRYVEIRIYSLSYPEYLQFHHLKNSQESFLRFIKYGGMPHIINLPQEDRIIYEYLRNIQNTIVLRDVVARFRVRNISFLHDLIYYLADTVGSILSAKRISDYLKSQKINLSPKIVIEYLSYLEYVYFVERVKRAEVIGRKIFEIGDKFYFEDLGMRHALIPYRQKDISKVLENIVFHHLKVCDYHVTVGKLGDREIDFIAEKDGETTYIQVAYLIPDSNTHKREFGNLLSIPDNFRKIVLSMDAMESGKFKGIEHISIRDFLSNIT